MAELAGDNLTPGRALWVLVWEENPTFRQVPGICSALAVTSLVSNTVLMCAALIWPPRGLRAIMDDSICCYLRGFD